MPKELIDQPMKKTFSFPGLQDKSCLEVLPESIPETVPVTKPKPKKEAVVLPLGRRPLKLGKKKD